MKNVTLTYRTKDLPGGRKRGLTLADLREFLDEASRCGIASNEPVKVVATWSSGVKSITATAGTTTTAGRRK